MRESKYSDLRYGTIKVLHESGHIKSIPDIFQFIPRTVVYKDLGVNFNRFCRAIYDPSKFRLEELIQLSELFCIDAAKLISMAVEEALAVKKKQQVKKSKTGNFQKKYLPIFKAFFLGS